MREGTEKLINEIKALALEGYTNTEIGRLLYKHPSYIGRMARLNDIKINKQRHVDKHVSEMHLKLGKILLERRTYELRKKLTEMSKYSRISSTRLANIESGICNLTFSEFLEVCKYYELDPREVIARIS